MGKNRKWLRTAALVLMLAMAVLPLAGCGGSSDEGSGDSGNSGSSSKKDSVIDYMVLVNKENPLPDGWEEALDIVELKDSQGWDVQVESTAYDAYLGLKEDLEKDDIHVDLDSAYRSIEEQQRIVDEFTEKYGEEYVKQYVAVPGYSEHHTGLALDLYLNIDGEDVYLNEEMVKYPEVWAQIHAKLADHGFILRYPLGKADITGYSYEPWHIRYVGVEPAKEIMSQGITLEEYLGQIPETAAKVDMGESILYDEEDMADAVRVIKETFETDFSGCKLQSITYAGDECNSDENKAWLSSLSETKTYTEVIEFKMDFHSPEKSEDAGAFNPDQDYKAYQWWLARTNGGDWEVVTYGY